MEEDDDFNLEDELERELEAGMDVDEGILQEMWSAIDLLCSGALSC